MGCLRSNRPLRTRGSGILSVQVVQILTDSSDNVVPTRTHLIDTREPTIQEADQVGSRSGLSDTGHKRLLNAYNVASQKWEV